MRKHRYKDSILKLLSVFIAIPVLLFLLIHALNILLLAPIPKHWMKLRPGMTFQQVQGSMTREGRILKAIDGSVRYETTSSQYGIVTFMSVRMTLDIEDTFTSNTKVSNILIYRRFNHRIFALFREETKLE